MAMLESVKKHLFNNNDDDDAADGGSKNDENNNDNPLLKIKDDTSSPTNSSQQYLETDDTNHRIIKDNIAKAVEEFNHKGGGADDCDGDGIDDQLA